MLIFVLAQLEIYKESCFPDIDTCMEDINKIYECFELRSGREINFYQKSQIYVMQAQICYDFMLKNKLLIHKQLLQILEEKLIESQQVSQNSAQIVDEIYNINTNDQLNEIQSQLFKIKWQEEQILLKKWDIDEGLYKINQDIFKTIDQSREQISNLAFILYFFSQILKQYIYDSLLGKITIYRFTYLFLRLLGFINHKYIKISHFVLHLIFVLLEINLLSFSIYIGISIVLEIYNIFIPTDRDEINGLYENTRLTPIVRQQIRYLKFKNQ